MIYEGKVTEVLLKFDGYEWYSSLKNTGQCIISDCQSKSKLLVVTSLKGKKYALICEAHFDLSVWNVYRG